jgi:type IV pilus assembly protein PilQ
VVTADGKEATIKIVQQEPIPQFTFNTRTAAFEISGFQYKDIGNILVVTPRINKDNFITLDLAPEVSNIADFRRFSGTPAGGTGGGSGLEANIPVINTRTLNTRVIMRNGDTLAIGGLIETTKANSYTKVPVIGDVPVVGMFFRNRRLDTVKRNLLVFMTPTVIPAGGKTGFEDQAEGLKVEEIYADDPWLPKDNAKPKHWQLPEAKPHKGPSAKKAAPAPKK